MNMLCHVKLVINAPAHLLTPQAAICCCRFSAFQRAILSCILFIVGQNGFALYKVSWRWSYLTLASPAQNYLTLNILKLLNPLSVIDWKTLWKVEKLLTVFCTHLENFLPFSTNLKLLSANIFSFEESTIFCLEKV